MTSPKGFAFLSLNIRMEVGKIILLCISPDKQLFHKNYTFVLSTLNSWINEIVIMLDRLSIH